MLKAFQRFLPRIKKIKPAVTHMHHHHSHKSSLLGLIRSAKYNLDARAGPAAYARAVRKYSFESPLWVGRRGVVFRRQTPLSDREEAVASESEVPAEDLQNDVAYVVPVTIGTPGVTLNLDFDTGSSDLWVWSSEMRASSSAGHTIYNPKNSSTSQVVKGAKWKISYGDGSSASGDVYTDTIQLGAVTLPGQGVELASKLSSSFMTDGGSDGLLGLAFPSLNTVTPTQQKTPVENLMEKGLIDQPLFTVMLDKGDSNGFYSFGMIDAAKAGVNESDIIYTPVDSSKGFWMFGSSTATINGKNINRPSNTAIADTGTTICLLDDTIVNAIYKTIPGSKVDRSIGGWVYPEDADIPQVQLAVGEALFTLNASDFAFAPANSGFTFGGIQSRGDNSFDILGDVFLKSVYVVFDQGETRIGMAQRPNV